MDNLNFYNRHKPSSGSAKPSHGDASRASKGRSTIETFAEKSSRSPATQPMSNRSPTKQKSKERGSKMLENNQSHPRSDFLRGETSSSKRSSKVRHSIYTDQPSAFSHYSMPQNFDTSVSRKSDFVSGQSASDESMWSPRGRLEFDSNSSVESSHTASSSGLEVVERNRKSYYRIKQPPKMDDVYEKIEVSIPCDL